MPTNLSPEVVIPKLLNKFKDSIKNRKNRKSKNKQFGRISSWFKKELYK